MSSFPKTDSLQWPSRVPSPQLPSPSTGTIGFA